MNENLKSFLVGIGTLSLSGFIMGIIFKPAVNVASVGFDWIVLIALIISAIVVSAIDDFTNSDFIATKFFWGASVAWILFFAIVGISSSKMANSVNYRNTVIPEETEFADAIGTDDVLPIVDLTSVKKLGDRTMGQVPSNVASQYEVSNSYTLISYNGEAYYLAPLEYGGLLKYNNSKALGIPGYVLVNATTQEAQIVLDKTFYYSDSAFFGKDIYRHLRNRYPSLLFSEYCFEIDDEGNPYWIFTVVNAKAGLTGNKTVGNVIVVDAVTGEDQIYAPDDIPSWVDNIYSAKYLFSKVDNYYTLVNGYWNSCFGKSGVKKLSYSFKESEHDENSNTMGLFTGYSAFNCNGDTCYFTGVTSSGSDESIYGFIICNARTGEVKYVACPGAEESSAMAAAEGLVKNMEYTASYPVIVNEGGVETYFIVLRDSAEIVKEYALVNVKNYTISAHASSLQEAEKMYYNALNGNGTVTVTNNSDTEIVIGTVKNVYTAVIEGNTYFYYTLDGDNSLYMSSITVSSKQITIATGDKVAITYSPSLNEEDGVNVVTDIQKN